MAIGSQHSVIDLVETLAYLQRGPKNDPVDPKDRVDWTASRNLCGTEDPELIRLQMEATVRLADQRVTQPFYHFSVSFHPDDQPRLGREQMEAIADQVLEDLGLSDRQAWIVAHKDTDHPHFHVLVNRIDMETGRAWSRWQDRPRMQKSLRHIEKVYGLTEVRGWLYGEEPEEIRPSRTDVLKGQRSTSPTFVARAKELGIPEELKAAQSWADLTARLAAYGLVLQRAGRGLQITNGDQVGKISALHRGSSLKNLEARFGQTWESWVDQSPDLAEPARRRPPGQRSRPDVEVYEARAQAAQVRLENDAKAHQLKPTLEKLERQLDGSNAEAIGSYLDEAKARFREHLGQAYKDPEAAEAKMREFFSTYSQDEVRAFESWLRQRPEHFGELVGYRVFMENKRRQDARKYLRWRAHEVRRPFEILPRLEARQALEARWDELMEKLEAWDTTLEEVKSWRSWKPPRRAFPGVPGHQLRSHFSSTQVKTIVGTRGEEAMLWRALADLRSTITTAVGDPWAEEKPRIEALLRDRSTFTRTDVRRLVAGYPNAEAWEARLLDQAVALGLDGRGRQRYTSGYHQQAEASLYAQAGALQRQTGSIPSTKQVEKILELEAPWASAEQRAVIQAAAQGPDLALVVGRPGTGKTDPVARVLARTYEDQGRRVVGLTLAGKAAEGLGTEAGIDSWTYAKWEYWAWALPQGGVLIVDEAGMLSTQQMATVLEKARRARMRVVLIGDPDQIQPIGAGPSFRGLIDRQGAHRLETIRRQRVDWQREASLALCRGEIRKGLEAYASRGRLSQLAFPDAAMEALIRDYMAEVTHPRHALVIASTNAERRALNRRLRQQLQAAGRLDPGSDPVPGDRVLFLENSSAGGYRNGTLGTVIKMEGPRLSVLMDSGYQVTAEWPSKSVDFGYAVTAHKAQGMTVGRTYLLFGHYLDRHLGLVGMTRHRSDLRMYYDQVTYPSFGQLLAQLHQQGRNDLVADYASLEPEQLSIPEARWTELSDRLSSLDIMGWKPNLPKEMTHRIVPREWRLMRWAASSAFSVASYAVQRVLDIDGPRLRF